MNMKATDDPNLVPDLTPTPKPATTPGWQTSEFWMTALGHVGLVLAAASGALPAKYAAVAGAVSQVAYMLSRGFAKASSGAQ